MASQELDRLKQDMQDRPKLAEKVRQALHSAKTEAEAAELLAGLGYEVPAGGILTGGLAARELDDESLDQVTGAGTRKAHFS
jgi:hypothetical protein